MTKRTERAERTQAENGAGPAPAHLVEPMLAGMTTTRRHLLAWVHTQGLAALDELFREEAVALAGPKGRHQPSRRHHHWGTTATELTSRDWPPDARWACLKKLKFYRSKR